MKINFKQPKYILPIVIVPILIFGNYLYAKYSPKEIGPVAVAIQGVNSNIPQPILKENHDKNKFEAFTASLLNRKRTEKSYIMNIEDKKIPALTLEGNLSKEDRIKLDSLKKMIKKDEERAKRITNQIKSGNYQNTSTSKKSVYANKKRKSTQKSSMSKRKRKNKSDEMADFKQQVRIMDSIQNPEKYKVVVSKINDVEPVAKLSKTKVPQNNFFNTIKAKEEDSFITALLDQGVKVWEGSRVRIRLMQDVFIDDHLLKKGKYLYGTVSGFKTQRVKININSIAIGDQVIKVNIDIYDNDGIQGLYVPDSQFREFVKDLGVSASRDAISLGTNGGNLQQQGTKAMYQSLSTAIRSSSKAISKALRKNKAKLKYNTQVFLINTQTK